jgi:hypothetical protein
MTHEQIREKMELIGLTVNGKAISFAKFKSIADAHQYGSRSNKIYIVYYGHPRQNLFGFYPPQTTKKEIALRQPPRQLLRCWHVFLQDFILHLVAAVVIH